MSNKPCQYLDTDYWIDDILHDNDNSQHGLFSLKWNKCPHSRRIAKLNKKNCWKWNPNGELGSFKALTCWSWFWWVSKMLSQNTYLVWPFSCENKTFQTENVDSGVRGARSLVFCVMFCRPLFVIFSLFYFGHICIVCPYTRHGRIKIKGIYLFIYCFRVLFKSHS